MTQPPILVVEDEPRVASVIRLYLENAGFTVELAADGREALARARAQPPRLIVLDVMLPHVDGFEVCRTLRAESDVPIIVVTARAAEADRLEGLELGADDYLTKPFSPRELVARVRTVLRRVPAEAPGGPAIERAGVRIDPARHEVTVRGTRATLTAREFRLLWALARAAGRAFTRAELCERALGADFVGLERTIDVHVKNLRRKLAAAGADPPPIETVPGVGYRFAEHA